MATPRRGFMKKSIGLLSLSLLPNINVFSQSKTEILSYSVVGLGEIIQTQIAETLKGYKIVLKKANDSDIVFIGKTELANIANIKALVQKNRLIVIEQSNIDLTTIKEICITQKAHLAEVQQWETSSDTTKLFEKITFIETNIDKRNIDLSINYLNVLSKLSTPTGMWIA